MQDKKLKFVFFGTPEVASKTLEILKKNDYLPSLIVTAPDKPQGRKMLITPPPVKIWAKENNIPYIQPEKVSELLVFFENITKDSVGNILQNLGKSDGDEQREFSPENSCDLQNISDTLKSENFIPDLFVVVAYGKILPKALIDIPKIMTLNIHYSLLPKYRGASPVESAILNGEEETGVSIQKMELKMDTGPLLAEEKTQIKEHEKTEELKERLIVIGGNLLVEILPSLENNSFILKEQNEKEATYCKKIEKEDGLIDLEESTPKNIYNKFRAYHKWPRIYFFENDKRAIITDATLENDKFIIKKIIPEGKKETTWQDYLKSKKEA